MSTATQNHDMWTQAENERLEQQEHNDLLAEQFDGRLCCRIAYLEGCIDTTQRSADKLSARLDELNNPDIHIQ